MTSSIQLDRRPLSTGCLRKPLTRRSVIRPRLEILEARELLSGGDWFDTNLPDPGVAGLVRVDWYDHGAVNYNDTLAIYGQVAKDGVVDTDEYNSLKFLAINGSVLNTPQSVRYLASQVIGHNSANQHYQGWSVGDVTPDGPAWKLQTLVCKWFLGMDHPAVPQGLTYRSCSGTVFASSGPSYADVDQGAAADCWLLSALATTAYREPNVIRSMFTDNGNNTYTVRFYFGSSPVYVTVDNQVPLTASGTFNYAKEPQNVLWVALAEKAYAQLNEFSSNITMTPEVNSYAALDWSRLPQAAITLSAVTGTSTYYSVASNFTSQLLAGNVAVILSPATPASPYIVAQHFYAVLDYNSSTGMYTVFNPWGVDAWATHGKWGVFYANAPFLAQNFIGSAWGGSTTTEQAVVDVAVLFRTPTEEPAPAPAPTAPTFRPDGTDQTVATHVITVRLDSGTEIPAGWQHQAPAPADTAINRLFFHLELRTTWDF